MKLPRDLLLCALLFVAALVAGPARADVAPARDYRFDGTISREVLDNYLSRAMSMEGLLSGRGDFDDNLRMLQSTGAKFIGRSLCLWGHEAGLAGNLERARRLVPQVHAADPEMVLQGCIFEIVTTQVEQVPVPEWALTRTGSTGPTGCGTRRTGCSAPIRLAISRCPAAAPCTTR